MKQSTRTVFLSIFRQEGNTMIVMVDRTVEVLMEYDESDKMLVMGALNATINEWAGLV